ncbi:MAG: hypothetical protein IJ484_06075 [Oscillospiraceae bacterium]|nr:hypothetical protein [Oscillospiraceae bacterium]
MREKIQRFMIGRYGHDSLNKDLSTAALVLMVLSLLFGWNLCSLLATAALILLYYRMLSRDIASRSRENAMYYQLKQQAKNKLHQMRTRLSQSKNYHFYRCPQCRQTLRVPRGRGKIAITCPKCHTEFVKKS